MRKGLVSVNKIKAGVLEELASGKFQFSYFEDYTGAAVSLTMPTKQRVYEFITFPAFFEGLLPEGSMLEALLKKAKLDRNDYFGQLLLVGSDVVGAVSIEEMA